MTFQQDQVDLLFDKLIHRPWGYACWQPLIDVMESARSYIIVMDLPGMDPGDVHVFLSHRKITVEGQRIPRPPSYGHRHCCTERPRGVFQRSIDIPQPVASDISKQYEQGVLTITLQKQGEAS